MNVYLFLTTINACICAWKVMTPQFSPELGALNIKDQTGRSAHKEVELNK
jgi:hypothetical protein